MVYNLLTMTVADETRPVE